MYTHETHTRECCFKGMHVQRALLAKICFSEQVLQQVPVKHQHMPVQIPLCHREGYPACLDITTLKGRWQVDSSVLELAATRAQARQPVAPICTGTANTSNQT